jgi:NADPH-dependent 2,4-dienoyl-CoA reductase/sulfur reductase-like enzyme
MAPLPHHVLIVGAGAAGTSAATELRRLGFRGQVTILNGEEVPPYNRTMVNSILLRSDSDPATVGQGFPDDEATAVLTGARARSLDLQGRFVRLADGRQLRYDSLLIASGARALELPAEIHEAARRSVTTLRSAADAARVRDALGSARVAGRSARVVVAGAGLLGSETADALSDMGHPVHLVDPADSPLKRLLGPGVASWVDQQHRGRLAGVWQDTVLAVQPGGRDGGVQVRLRSGTPVHADLVVAALGVVPDVGWLAATGLETAQGVVTDDHLRVRGAPGTYAAGDVARVRGGPKGEHWGHALAQGSHAARTIAYDLGLTADPGPWAGSASFATRLYGAPITVLGTPTGDPFDLVGEPTGELHVAAATTTGSLDGVVVRGPMKIANRLRPLVAAHAPVEDAVAVLAQIGFAEKRRAS